jgi:hypothetical protein
MTNRRESGKQRLQNISARKTAPLPDEKENTVFLKTIN